MGKEQLRTISGFYNYEEGRKVSQNSKNRW